MGLTGGAPGRGTAQRAQAKGKARQRQTEALQGNANQRNAVEGERGRREETESDGGKRREKTRTRKTKKETERERRRKRQKGKRKRRKRKVTREEKEPRARTNCPRASSAQIKPEGEHTKRAGIERMPNPTDVQRGKKNSCICLARAALWLQIQHRAGFEPDDMGLGQFGASIGENGRRLVAHACFKSARSGGLPHAGS